MIEEFKLPLKAEGCSSKADEREIKNIILNNLIDYQNKPTIDHEEALWILCKTREDSKRLVQAFVTIIDKKYRLKARDDKKPPKYGVGYEEGLVILRYTHEEAIRHEVGHMFGLNHHGEGNYPPNPTCIMNWECPSTQFCDACKKELEIIWEKELKGKH